jgi:predicted thioesterase
MLSIVSFCLAPTVYLLQHLLHMGSRHLVRLVALTQMYKQRVMVAQDELSTPLLIYSMQNASRECLDKTLGGTHTD